MPKAIWRFVPLSVFLILTLFFGRGLTLSTKLPSTREGKPIPSFMLPSLLAKSSFSSKQLANHWGILVIWGSWCDACLEEQSFLLQLAAKGIHLYGINYKDNERDAKKWLRRWGNPYLDIGMDLTGEIGLQLGVYGAPETFLYDSKGIIRYRYPGILSAQVWQQEFMPRIKNLE